MQTLVKTVFVGVRFNLLLDFVGLTYYQNIISINLFIDQILKLFPYNFILQITSSLTTTCLLTSS